MQWLDRAPDGLRLAVTSPPDAVEAAAAGTEAIILEFDVFRDGRGFSLAAILRERGFKGRLIADGQLIPDQARHLRRSGFDAVVVGANADVAAWGRMDEAFSAVYQPAEDQASPIWRSRQGWRGSPSSRPRPSPGQDVAAAEPVATDLKADDFEARPTQSPTQVQDRSHLTTGVVDGLNAVVRDDNPESILHVALKDNQNLRPAVLSSFGAEAAVLLSFVARIDPTTPVVFLDTGMHFLQTLSYRNALASHFGLTDLRIVTPFSPEGGEVDLDPDLWRSDPDACCDQRKVRPLERALQGIDLVITGRKQHQTADRAGMKPFELFNNRIRVNPLLSWSSEQIEDRFVSQNLPRHPLTLNGYPSIGCWPCTQPVASDQVQRGGRWAGTTKTECGIHRVRQAHSVG